MILNRKSDVFLIVIIVISILASWKYMIFIADTLPRFDVDEVANVQAAVSLLTDGAYKSDHYNLIYSSGCVVTWPGSVGWLIGRNLFGSRLGNTFFTWGFALLLGYCFFRRFHFTKIEALASATFLWAFITTTPFAFPYWFGFMYTLGETNTLILFGFGLLLISKRPYLGAFIMGLTVFHGKFITMPLAGAVLLANLISQKLSVKDFIKNGVMYAILFLLPLLI